MYQRRTWKVLKVPLIRQTVWALERKTVLCSGNTLLAQVKPVPQLIDSSQRRLVLQPLVKIIPGHCFRYFFLIICLFFILLPPRRLGRHTFILVSRSWCIVKWRLKRIVGLPPQKRHHLFLCLFCLFVRWQIWQIRQMCVLIEISWRRQTDKLTTTEG